MASNLLSIEYEDSKGRTGTFGVWLEETYNHASAQTLALIQAFKNLTQAKVKEASVSMKVNISTLTGNNAADSGSYDTVRDQAILQIKRADNTGFLSLTVPAPVDSIFVASGPRASQDVDPASAGITGLIAAGVTVPTLSTPQGGVVTFSKGWRKGQPHS